MTKGPPESPPAADWGPELIKHYPPHGFPPYLGLGLLDAATIRLEPGRSVAEYRAGSDLVYRVTGTFDPAEGDVACAAKASEWSIEEYFSGRSWRTTDGYESLPQAFYHHIGGQLPTENPRLRALIDRLVQDFHVAVRIRAQTSYVMFPAGYVYAIRVPLTAETVENFKDFAATEPELVAVPPPTCDRPQSVAILTLSTTYGVHVERGSVVDVTVPLYRADSSPPGGDLRPRRGPEAQPDPPRQDRPQHRDLHRAADRRRSAAAGPAPGGLRQRLVRHLRPGPRGPVFRAAGERPVS
jgi:hypothetical protein